MTGIIFASNAVAELWQRAKAHRHDVLRPATDIMLNLANVRPGYRVLDVAAGTGDQTLTAARLVGPTGYVTGDRHFAEYVEHSCRRRAKWRAY